MDFSNILVSRDKGISKITINRPKVSNSLNEETLLELKQALDAMKDSFETRVIIITGAGERAFSCGADIHALSQEDVFEFEIFVRLIHETFSVIRTHPAPVIAAINGRALGAGLELVMSCDIAIAAENAQLGMPEVKIGLPSVIECALMPNLIGLMRTRELLLTGDPINAKEAYRIGLVNKVVPQYDLSMAAQRMAENLISNNPRALFLQKELINCWLNLPMEQAIEAGIKSAAMACASGVPRRAIDAFLAKQGKRK